MSMPQKPRRNCKNCNKECSKPEKFYCNYTCQHSHQRWQYIIKWKTGEIDGLAGKRRKELSQHIRNYLLERSEYSCSQCGWSKKNLYTGKVPLQIDHIDGNWKNNRPKNLRVLCPNCHSLTPTFGGLNKGKGREWRYNASSVTAVSAHSLGTGKGRVQDPKGAQALQC